LNEEPESQDDQGRNPDQLHKDEEKEQSKNPRAREEQQIGTQNAGDSPARTNHGNFQVRVSDNLDYGSEKTTNKIEEEKTKMAKSVFNVVSENPKIQHVSEEVQETTMEEHGGKDRERKGDQRNNVEHLSMGDLIGNGPPLKNEALTFSKIQHGLMKKNKDVDQYNPDGDQRKRRSRIIVFKGEQQELAPFS
jgi:hypothetical protein